MKLRSVVGTVFMQRERYLKRYNISGYPRQHFIQDLVSFMISLLDGNNKIIVAADTNNYTIDRRLLRELKSIEIIDVYEKNSIYLAVIRYLDPGLGLESIADMILN